MYCYAFAVLFALSVATLTAAYMPVNSIYFRRNCNLHTRILTEAHPSLSHVSQRKCWSESQTLFHCGRRRILNILASAKRGDETAITDIPNVTGVTLKMAFDSSPVWGVADLSETKSERFTSPDSLDMVHRLRRESSAVLVGRGTVEFDDCSLTVRRVELGEGKNQPVRVVLDPSLSLVGGDYTLLKDGLPTIIYYLQTEDTDETLKATTKSDSVTLVRLRPSDVADDDGGRSSISPSEVVRDLADRGLHHIMVEGGPATARAFLDAGVVDRAILVRAPIEFEIPVPALIDEHTLRSAGLNMIGTAAMGGDNVEYWTRDGLPWPNAELYLWP